MSVISNAQELKTYFNDTIEVDEHNIPIHKDQSYAPKDFEQAGFGWSLYVLKEPLLFNKALDKEVYRLTWFRSFHNPIIVTCSKKEENYLLAWTELKEEQLYADPKIREALVDKSQASFIKFLKIVDRFTYQERKKVSKTNWDQWIELINEVDYWNLDPDGGLSGLDGSTIYLEYASNSGYKIVERWTPRKGSPLYRLYHFMIDLTDLEIPEKEKY
jgi:hypothetical protein